MTFLTTFSSSWLTLDGMSTPERFYIVWPEQKYISDASNKASDIGGLIAFRGSFLRGYVRC